MAAVQKPGILLYNVPSFDLLELNSGHLLRNDVFQNYKYDYIMECVFMFVNLWSRGVTSWILFPKPQA